MPANRLPTGNHLEQTENETIENPEKIESSTDKIKDQVAIKDQDMINDTETSAFVENKTSPINNDSTMNNIEKQESPKKFSDYIPKDDPSVENKLKNIENNVEEKEIDTSAPEEILEKVDPVKNLSPLDSSMRMIENEQIEEASDAATKAEKRLEKPISPPSMEPPPKPPRQNSGSGSNSSTTPSSPIKNFNSEMVAEIHEKMENELKEDTFSIHSVDTQKTRSAKSKRGEDEEIHREDDIISSQDVKKENGEEEKKKGSEIIDDVDDADDVQSPVSRTGEKYF